jgi:hypothetical protein
MPTMSAWINPLRCIPIDAPQPGGAPTPDASELLDYLFAPEAERTAEAFAGRYRDVVSVAAAFPFAPAEPTLLQKLVWPLRHAIGSYCLADYLGCVALSGMVGEMVATLLWEIYALKDGAVGLRPELMAYLDARSPAAEPAIRSLRRKPDTSRPSTHGRSSEFASEIETSSAHGGYGFRASPASFWSVVARRPSRRRARTRGTILRWVPTGPDPVKWTPTERQTRCLTSSRKDEP